MLINLFSVFGRSQKWERDAKYLCFGALNDAHKMQNTTASVRSIMSAKATIFASALPNMGARCKMSLFRCAVS